MTLAEKGLTSGTSKWLNVCLAVWWMAWLGEDRSVFLFSRNTRSPSSPLSDRHSASPRNDRRWSADFGSAKPADWQPLSNQRAFAPPVARPAPVAIAQNGIQVPRFHAIELTCCSKYGKRFFFFFFFWLELLFKCPWGNKCPSLALTKIFYNVLNTFKISNNKKEVLL